MATGANQKIKELYEFGPFRVDPDKQTLLRDGEPVALTPKSLQLLLVLLRRHNEIVTKDELLKTVWPDTFVEETNLTRNVFSLRKALGETEQNRYIITVPGQGYRLAEDVRLVPDQELNIVVASHSKVQVQVNQAKPSLWVGAALVLVVVVAVGAFRLFFYRSPILTEADTMVLADFANSTGDPVFDGTLRQGLAVQLEQSPFLSLIPEERIRQTLQLMGRPADARLTPELAQEVCERTGSAAVLDGSIVSLGSQYVLGLRAKNCRNGNTLDEEQVQAAKKEDVLNAMSQIATKFRVRVGESLSTVQQHNTPLPEATTSSLGALKAFALGEVQQIRNLEVFAAAPFYQRAIELDPNFAMAYARLATIYSDLGQSDLSDEYRKKAFQLRDRTSEHEKFYITAHYYLDGGQIDKGIQAWELYRQAYPRDSIPLNNLAMEYNVLGYFDKGLENAREAIRVNPATGAQYLLATWAYMGLHRQEEARAILDAALRRKIGGYGIHMALARLAMERHDDVELAREEAFLRTSPAAELSLLYFTAGVAASRGQLKRSEELRQQAQEAGLRSNLKEPAAQALVVQAQLEAAVGLSSRAIEDAHAALSLPASPGVAAKAVLALALAGRGAEAERLVAQLEKARPADQFIKFVGLPSIRAAID